MKLIAETPIYHNREPLNHDAEKTSHLVAFFCKNLYEFSPTLIQDLFAALPFCQLPQIREKHAGKGSKTLHQREKPSQHDTDGAQSLDSISH